MVLVSVKLIFFLMAWEAQRSIDGKWLPPHMPRKSICLAVSRETLNNFHETKVSS